MPSNDINDINDILISMILTVRMKRSGQSCSCQSFGSVVNPWYK